MITATAGGPALDAPTGDRYLVAGVADRPGSRAAARWAAREAADRELPLLLAHGYDVATTGLPLTDATFEAFRRGAEATVDAARAALVAPPGLAVGRVVEPLPPVPLLVRDLAAGAVMIVLRRDDVGVVRRFTDGAIADRVSAIAPCPVVVVPARREPYRRRTRSPRPVVVAIDGGTAATSALSAAFEMAERWRRPLRVLHAAPADEVAAQLRERRLNIEEILAGWKADHPDTRVEVLVVRGSPLEAIVGQAEHAELMIVARPHRQRIGSWRRSAAHDVIDRCDCPLMVVPGSALPSRQDGGGRSSALPGTNVPSQGPTGVPA